MKEGGGSDSLLPPRFPHFSPTEVYLRVKLPTFLYFAIGSTAAMLETRFHTSSQSGSEEVTRKE